MKIEKRRSNEANPVPVTFANGFEEQSRTIEFLLKPGLTQTDGPARLTLEAG
jgi:hypothetical protein